GEGTPMAKKKPRRASKLYDATFKHLVESRPRDALAYAGITDPGKVKVLDADLSTVIPEADKVLEVEYAGKKYIVHFEFQTGYDKQLLARLFSYNAVLFRRHGRPVWTVLVLLTREADSRKLTGELKIALPDGRRCHRFEYQVIRVWEQPLESVLAGGIGMLPVAPLCAGAAEDL